MQVDNSDAPQAAASQVQRPPAAHEAVSAPEGSGSDKPSSATHPVHPRLAFLESLTPEDALRYKVMNAAKIPLDVVSHILGENGSAFAEEEEREDLAVAISAAGKAFAIQMSQLAAEIRDAEEDATALASGETKRADAKRGPIRERHMVEAYRRLVLSAGSLLPAVAPDAAPLNVNPVLTAAADAAVALAFTSAADASGGQGAAMGLDSAASAGSMTSPR